MAATAEGNRLTRAEQDKMCRNKRKFRREIDAIDHAIRSFRRGALQTTGRVYRCPVCPGWHVTSHQQPAITSRAA